MVDQRIYHRDAHADAHREPYIADDPIDDAENRRMVDIALPDLYVADQDTALDHILGQQQGERRCGEQHQYIVYQQLGRGRSFSGPQHKRQAGQDAKWPLALRPVMDRALAQQVHCGIKYRRRQGDIHDITNYFPNLFSFFTFGTHVCFLLFPRYRKAAAASAATAFTGQGPLRFRVLLLAGDRDGKIVKLLCVHHVRTGHHQVGRVLHLGESDHVADGVQPRE